MLACKRQMQRILQLPPDLRRNVLRQLQNIRPSMTASSLPSFTSNHASYWSRHSSSSAQSSVNADEVAHFKELASTWWDPHGSSRLLHLMNPLRHKFIQTCLSSDNSSAGLTSTGLKLLDVGCGGGIFAESAARIPIISGVDAVDPTPEVIAVAKQHARSDPLLLEPGRLTYHNIALEQLPVPSEPQHAYDVVTLFEVIEHIREPAPFLNTALNYLKPGGWLIGSTIARTTTSWFTTKFVAEEVIGLVPRGTHDWNQYIQPHELKAWAAKQANVGRSSFMGVIYAPGIGWKEISGSETWGNYFFAFQKGSQA